MDKIEIESKEENLVRIFISTPLPLNDTPQIFRVHPNADIT